ncbi:MAG: hypothetical protein FGM42_02480 [Ilumatobacteraceae bacterium]|nr:hypothetical protein [Ilumatobacteraceae bacterium]
MTDPTTGHNDDALGAALRGMPRPSVDPAVREAHIAAALGALASSPSTETSGTDTDSNVVSLASRRRPRLMTLTAVAAAALFAVGIGIGRVSAPTTGSPDAAVKNSALTPSPAAGDSVVEGCPDLALDAPAVVVTTFGSYALYRAGSGNGATLVVVDTAACTIVTRVADPG